MPPLQFVVDRRENGKTLASALKLRYGLSWSQAKRLVAGRHVKVSGMVEIDVARRLKLGKRVELAPGTVEISTGKGDKADKAQVGASEGGKGKKGDQKAGSGVARARSPLDPLAASVSIVYQDDAVVVANKPAGLTTMRHAEEAAEFGEHGGKFLTKTLAGLLPSLLGAPGKPVIAVHRIDRDTSGLVVFARTRAAADALTNQFRKHTVERRYLALTRGRPSGGRIESVFVPDRGDDRRGSAPKTQAKGDIPDGKRAVSHLRVLEPLGDFALVECRLETGRTHQIRIHLGEAGTPLCGEAVYDRPLNGRPPPDASGATRPMLHAAKLGFVHPDNGEVMSWEVPPPPDFAALLKKLRNIPSV